MENTAEDAAVPGASSQGEASPPASPPPRLMITKMVLENFKSYAGVREIGPFHKCFSSIVGPNGSGKSNVIDAMLFVFGKRAKKLRLNKVSELIHKSSEAQKCDFARVSVYFQDIIDAPPPHPHSSSDGDDSKDDSNNNDKNDNDNDYQVVPNSECVVTRMARSDNSSSYKLNGKTVKFKDVALFLNSKGIDLDNNRFLILQGEVEMISMMPPKGRTEQDEGLLEYLEDIIGSNQYVEDTNLALQQLDLLTDQRQEKLNRVKAVEAEKDNLQGAKEEAQSLLNKEREIRRKKNILYQLHQKKLTQEADRVKEKQATVQTKLETERDTIIAAKARIDDIEEGLAQQRCEYDTVHQELLKTKQEFVAYERRDIKLREEIKHSKAQKKKLEQKLKTETQKEEKAATAGQEAETSIPLVEASIEKLTANTAEQDEVLEQILEETKGATDQLRLELDQKSNELAPVHQERAVFQAALDTALTETKLLQDSVLRSQEQLAQAEAELASLKEDEKRQQLAALEDELSKCQQDVVDAQLEDKELEAKDATLTKRNKELMSMVEETKAALRAKGGAASRSQAVQGILRASRKGGELQNVGVLGRLGDLAAIDAQYDVAVSTACGMLDHIVVQTTAGAQRCLAFLRKHGLGRANFIPLDKMSKGAHDRAVETPEGAPRLFELMAPLNFAVTPALYLSVQNTLVAPDLETATRWAYDFQKRWRVVTMDGQLIETSGTMAGGGKSVRKGGMRLKNSRGKAPLPMEDDDDASANNHIKDLEQEGNQVSEQLAQCRQRRRSIAKDILPALKKRIKALGVQIPKLAMALEDCDTTRVTLTERIPELRAQCQLSPQDEKKLVLLNKEVQSKKSDMSACAMQASKLEADVARLQKAILDAGGPKLKKQQAKCDKALHDLNAAEKQLNEARVAITSSAKAVEKARKAKAAAQEELEQVIVLLEEQQSEFATLEAGAMEVMQRYEQVKVTEADAKVALEQVTTEVDSLKKSQSKLKGVEVELMGQVEALQKQLAELERKGQHWEAEIEKLHAAAEEDDEDLFSDDEGDEDEKDEEMKNQEDEMVENEDDEEMEEKREEATQSNKPSSFLPRLTLAALEQYREEDIKKELSTLEQEHATLAKNANMGAIAEYRKKEADYLARVGELDAVTEERNNARRAHEELRRLRLEKFMDGFGQITLKLKEMYQMITLGGDAELELVDSLDPFSEGIVFSVRPPKKSWKNICNLSGGEKTLSSLALVFALHHYKPTPLYVMDEIDAALDFKNVSIVANYIKERTKNAQFIIISLRNNMFELADRLVGIYKTNNCTKSVTIDPRSFGIGGAPKGGTILGDRTNITTESNAV